MNPFGLDATQLLIWGVVAHLVADWMLQNDWMATNKAKRANLGEIPGDGMITAPSRMHPYTLWFIRHPAAYVHAAIHGLALAAVFGWVAAPLALAHLVIDTRAPVAWLSKLIRQTQPRPWLRAVDADAADPHGRPYTMDFDNQTIKVRTEPQSKVEELEYEIKRLQADMRAWTVPVLDLGTVVRMNTDQVWHVASLAIAALAVTL
jgi:hypothetical protein